MAVTTGNLVIGSANIYVAPTGTTEAGLTTVSSLSAPVTAAPWRDLGAIVDGVTITVSQDFTQLAADQIIDTVESRVTGRTVTVQANLGELTLANLQTALNGGTTSTGTGTSTYNSASATNTAPAYQALIIDGVAPSGKARRIIVRKALSTDNVEFAYKKDEQSVYTVTFTAHYVDANTSMFQITDAT